MKYIGLAVADFPGITARALDTIRTDRQNPLQVIGRLIAEEKVTKILLGFPFSETEGEIHRHIRNFSKRLEHNFPGIPVELADESYSSIEADELLQKTRHGRRKKKRIQDSQSARIVLLRYLNQTS